jgi:ATP-dependent DNA helicase DinG
MAKLASELTVKDVLGSEGIIEQFIPGFRTRQSQLEMAELIHESIQQKQHCAIEASTGIGKSFAYLVPAFLSKLKVVISTGTKNLQDQLYTKDLPLINKTIISGKKVALLKGRSNYCCPHRINKYRRQRRFQGHNMASLFDTLKHWSENTSTGDIAEFAELPENDSLWFYATSSSDNCLGSECPEFSGCFVMKARRKAQEADVIVINHHLFFSDQALKEEGFGELLPDVDVVIFDEAHQIPDVASHFFSRTLSKRQIDLALKDIVDAQVSEARESSEIQDFCQKHQKAADDLRLILGKFSNRSEWRNIQHAPAIVAAIDEMQATLQSLLEQLETIKSRGKDLASCHSRLKDIQQTLNDFLQPQDALVSWYEWNERSFRLMQSPVEVSEQFKRQLDRNQYKSVLFTSATLSANESFDYFTQRLGLDDIKCARFLSPFDYAQQAMLYLPETLPEPSSDQFSKAFIDECVALINATGGNCFILFTSYRMLSYSAQQLAKRIPNRLFIQGEKQRSELLHAYMQTPDSVLLGTSSFWEGVDVKGDKLKLVIIDKLPFKSPGDPVYKQRLQLVNKLGGNAFIDVQVPEATISLRQGVGRLIRDSLDRGLVMIADNRIRRKPYGKTMLNSLPDMKVTTRQSEALEFASKL